MVKIKSPNISLVFNIEIILVVLFLVPPMILYINNLVRGFVFTWPIFILWFLVILVKKEAINEFKNQIYNRKWPFLFLGLFICIVVYNYLYVQTTSRAFQYVAVFINFFFLLVIDSYYSVKPKKYKLSILFFIIVVLGVQAAVSIPYLLSTDFYVIRLFSSGQLDEAESLEAIRNGIGNNGLYSSIGAVSILGLSVINRFNFFPRIILFASIIFLIVTIVISTFFASIMLLILGGSILLFRYYKSVISPKVLVYILCLIVGGYYFYSSFLQKTNLLIPIEKKIDKFLLEGDVTDRTDLANVSLNTFMDNPFWGVGVPEMGSYHIIGEHMPWIDYFAHFGFFGFFPFLIFLLILIKNKYRFYFVNDQYKLYRTACFIGLVIFVFSNFISPMLTVPTMYMMVILFYTSSGNILHFYEKNNV